MCMFANGLNEMQKFLTLAMKIEQAKKRSNKNAKPIANNTYATQTNKNPPPKQETGDEVDK